MQKKQLPQEGNRNLGQIILNLSVLVLMVLGLMGAGQSRASAPMFARGGHAIHGSFSFSSGGNSFFQNADGDRTQEWTVTPGGGYFIAHGLALTLAFEGSWFTLGDVTSSEYSFGPVLEYYFDTIGDDEPAGHAVPYLGAGYLWGVVEEDSATSSAEYNSGLLSLTMGLSWFFTGHVATDIAINYKVGQYTEKHPSEGKEYAADRWSLFVGIKGFLY